MSSDHFVNVEDDSLYHHSLEHDHFSDPFSPFSDSVIDILQAFSEPKNLVSQQQPHYVEQSSQSVVSSSPPNYHLKSLSLYQVTPSSPLENDDLYSFKHFSALDNLEVKAEQCSNDHNGFIYNNQAAQHGLFIPHSYNGNDQHVVKHIQKSYSFNYFDRKPGIAYQPCFDSLMESSPSFQTQAASLSSPESSSYLTCQMMRRVSSTGDLQNFTTTRITQESSAIEEGGSFKMSKYTAEERKERILKYRSKRSQRNFNKTIKYACRKTLADNRPRIRGRFARNDEACEIEKPTCSSRDEDEDDLWIEGLNVEEKLRVRTQKGRQHFVNNIYRPPKFDYYVYYH